MRRFPDFGAVLENFIIFSQICFRLGRIITKMTYNHPLVLYEREWYRLSTSNVDMQY